MYIVYVDQGPEKVVVSTLDDKMAEFCEIIGANMIYQESNSLPAVTTEVRKLIEDNPFKSYNLYKVVDGAVTLRSLPDLQSSAYVEPNFTLKPLTLGV